MNKISNRKGFTLIEAIIAIAVIAILCAIGIPSIVRAKKDLDMKQEADYAKSIFLAAQDNLAAMKIDGSLVELTSEVPAASVYNETQDDLLGDVKTLIGDLAAELLEKDEARQYVYISSSSENFEKILPAGSIDSSIRGKNITIIYNPVTGDIFFVKYGNDGKFNGSVVNRAGNGNGNDEDYEDPIPVVKLVNGEENTVQITVPVPEDYQASINAYFNAITFKITVKDTSGNSFAYNLKASDNGENGFSFNSVTGVAEWALDSLVSGQSFADRNSKAPEKNGNKIAAGDNITVDVTYQFDTPSGCRDIEFDLSKSTSSGNSLFAAYSNNTISVSNGRHLQNLNNIDAALASNIAKTSGAQVKLTNNISWGETVQHYRSLVSGFKSFTTLKPSKLFADGSKVTVDGCGKSIRNLYIKDLEEDVGLFENLLVSVSNLTFIDPIIKGYGNVGALAGTCGYVEGTRKNTIVVDNCRVVLQSSSNGIDAILLGNSAVDSNTGDIYGVCTTGPSSVGLLIGCAFSTTVNGCTTNGSGKTDGVVDMGGAVMPASGYHFGMVLGYAENCTLHNIIVRGTVKGGSATNVGGIVGCTAGNASNVNYCNAYGGIQYTKATNVGGAVGLALGSGKFDNVGVSVNLNNIPSAANTDVYACPSTLGSVGKFVGYIDGGSFISCSGTGTADKAYQFLGVVKTTSYQPGENLYVSLIKFLKTVDAEKSGSDANTYKQKDGTALFSPATQYYKYDGITLKNCIYTNGSTQYKQEIASDKYYYTLGNREEGTSYKFKEVTDFDYTDTTPFLVLDDTKQYAFVLNANTKPEAILYTVDGVIDYYPGSDAYKRVTNSTTPIYFFNPTNSYKSYTANVMTDESGNPVYGLVYKDKNWPYLGNTVLRKSNYNVINTYFVMDDTTYTSKYDHVVYDVGTTYNKYDYNNTVGFDFTVTNGYYNAQGYTNTSYRNTGYDSARQIKVSPALVHTNTIRFELSTMKIDGFNAESSEEVIINKANYYSTLKNAFWQNVSLDEAGYNAGEKIGHVGEVLLRNMKYTDVTRTLSGETKTQPIYLTIADDKQYSATRGAFMTPSISYTHQDVSDTWRIDWNVRSLTIESKTDNSGKPYSTISRNWDSDGTFYLGMDKSTLYTKTADAVSNANFNHLHIYQLLSDKNGDPYSIATFSPTDSPAQIITSTKVA